MGLLSVLYVELTDKGLGLTWGFECHVGLQEAARVMGWAHGIMCSLGLCFCFKRSLWVEGRVLTLFSGGGVDFGKAVRDGA